MVARWLSTLRGFKITTQIGGHGVTVLLRADMDGLPIQEATGLEYYSDITMNDADGILRPVMHACGHDMHMILHTLRSLWRGTLIVLFQPAEERDTGARAMVDDVLYDPARHNIPVPDYMLGQHVMAMRAGTVGSKVGTIMAGADSMKIIISGVGGHGSQPHRTVDPAAMAAHVVVRLQSIVSRETNTSDIAVVNSRQPAYRLDGERHRRLGRNRHRHTQRAARDAREAVVLDQVDCGGRVRSKRCPGCACVKMTRNLPVTVNDEPMMETLATEFKRHFGDKFDANITATTIAEDFSVLATSQGRPCVFWHWGGIQESPANHTARFAPAIQPTMRTGIDALVVAALTFLDKPQE
ncbi:amidohydrolase [Apodospora peruviana]|uniref:Amidohydrolase n=1 Tax=Apodospora peruviana TaxID=516989 RepID=A0AAE0M1P3_9PEZI|nr:amidohydrolase [Apodospora peruviana]